MLVLNQGSNAVSRENLFLRGSNRPAAPVLLRLTYRSDLFVFVQSGTSTDRSQYSLHVTLIAVVPSPQPGGPGGMRPGMPGGGFGGYMAPQTKGSGAMGIIMPIYTVGIVIFFVYTIMRVS